MASSWEIKHNTKTLDFTFQGFSFIKRLHDWTLSVSLESLQQSKGASWEVRLALLREPRACYSWFCRNSSAIVTFYSSFANVSTMSPAFSRWCGNCIRCIRIGARLRYKPSSKITILFYVALGIKSRTCCIPNEYSTNCSQAVSSPNNTSLRLSEDCAVWRYYPLTFLL